MRAANPSAASISFSGITGCTIQPVPPADFAASFRSSSGLSEITTTGVSLCSGKERIFRVKFGPSMSGSWQPEKMMSTGSVSASSNPCAPSSASSTSWPAAVSVT